MAEENDAIKAFRDEPPQEEPKDRTKWVWLGIFLLIVGMIFYLWVDRSPRPVSTSVRARHILISYDTSDPVDRGRAYERISELRERIEAGESFERLARTYSDCTASARRGGDLGWAPRETYAPAFEQYCWGAPVGELSDVVHTNFGFHLIVVEDRHIADADLYEIELERRAFEELRDEEAEETPEEPN